MSTMKTKETERYLKRRVQFKALSPVHLGSGEVWKPLEVAHLDETLYVISRAKWARFLQQEGRQGDYLAFIRGRLEEDRPAHLQGFLEERGWLRRELLEEIALYTVRCPQAAAATSPSGMRAFARNGYQQPYVPGSAVKGALRVAILFALLERLPEANRRSLLTRVINQGLSRLKSEGKSKVRKQFAQALDRELLQGFSLQGKRGEPHTDILRVLHVHDSEPLPSETIRVEEIKVYSVGATEPKGFSIYAECLEPGTEFSIEFTIDQETLADFRKASQTYGLPFEVLEELVRNPFEAARRWVQALLNHERKFFEEQFGKHGVFDFGDEEEPTFRVGWGGGMLGTTIDLLLPPGRLREVRNRLFKNRGTAPAPKTRRLTVNDRPLGWCTVLAPEPKSG